MSNITRGDMRQLKSKILIESLASRSLYLGVNGTAAWSDEFDPPQPHDTAKTLHDFWDHLVGFVRVKSENTWSAIPHVKWIKGRTFELRNVNEDIDFQMRHYCVNSEFEVYECVNITKEGTEYPRVVNEPKGHNEGNIISTDDGYQWKFLYKLKSSDVENKTSHDYIPVYVKSSDFTDTQKRFGSIDVEHILNVRHIACRVELEDNAIWTTKHYRQYGLFIDIRDITTLDVATADTLAPSDVLDESGYLIYTENIKKRPFEANRTDIIDIVIEC